MVPGNKEISSHKNRGRKQLKDPESGMPGIGTGQGSPSADCTTKVGNVVNSGKGLF